MTNSDKIGPPDDLARIKNSPQAMASWRDAQIALRDGRHAPALAGYRILVQQFPGVLQLWTELGSAAMGDLEFALAAQAFQRAADLAPANAATLVSIGMQF